jgi:hypothetical protein
VVIAAAAVELIPPPFTYKGYRVQALWELAGERGYIGVARITREQFLKQVRTALAYGVSDAAVRRAEDLARKWIDEHDLQTGAS